MEALGLSTVPGLTKVTSPGAAVDVSPFFSTRVDVAFFLPLGVKAGPLSLALEAILPFLMGEVLETSSQGLFSLITTPFVDKVATLDFSDN